MYNILKQKNKAINIYRQKEGFQENPADLEYEKKLEELNSNFINNNEILLDISKDDIISTKYNYDNNNNNDRLTQLLNENENKKKKIDLLNNKIKSLNNLENKSIKTNYNNINSLINIRNTNGNTNINTTTTTSTNINTNNNRVKFGKVAIGLLKKRERRLFNMVIRGDFLFPQKSLIIRRKIIY